MNRYVIITLLIIFLFLGGIANLAGATEVSGVLDIDTTWTWAKSPYIVVGSVNVASGATLTIEPGVEVKFDGDFSLVIDGTLIAVGTEDKNITFTSNQSSQAPGDWDKIQFRDTSVDENCIIEYAVIEYGKTGVRCDYASPTIQHSTLRYHDDAGIVSSQTSDGPIIKDNTITQNNIYGINADYCSNVVIEGNTISDNNYTGVYIYGGTVTLTGNTISNNFRQGVHIVAGSVTLTENTITNNTGSWSPESRGFGGGVWESYGTLTATGNTITGNQNGVGLTADDWTEITGNTITGNNVGLLLYDNHPFNFNNLQDNSLYAVYIDRQGTGSLEAGYNWWGTTDASVIAPHIRDFYDDSYYYKVDYSPVMSAEVTDTTIPGPASPMVIINGGASTTNSRDVLLELSAESATEMILSEDFTFADASWEAYTPSKAFTLSEGDGQKYVYAKFRNVDQEESALAFNSIILSTEGGPTEVSGVLMSDTTWTEFSSPYIVVGSVNIASGATLTIEPGVEVKFDGDFSLVIDGTLIAVGTEAKNITFTSNQPSPAAGDWGSIQFRDTSVDEACLIEYAVIEYGETGVMCDSASPTIRNSMLRYHDYSGIGSSHTSDGPIIQNNTITQNNINGIDAFHCSNVVIEGNTISNNGSRGVSIVDRTVTLTGNTISNNSRQGVYIAGASVTLTENTITNNAGSWSPESGGDGGGVWASGPLTATGNTITDNSNGVGLKAHSWTEIAGNTITGNKVGLLLDDNHPFNFNNLQDNSLYDVYIQGQGSRSLEAGYNWWGTTDASVIAQHIRDFYDDFNYYKVDYSPMMSAEVTDTTVPGPSSPMVIINGGASTTDSRDVLLELSAESAIEMIISEDFTFANASWEAYAPSKAFTLSEGDGQKYVYAKFRNAALEESAIAFNSIILSTGPQPGPTEVSGVLTSDTTWTEFSSPYIVVGSVNVTSGVTLTIEPGVEVKFDGDFSLVIDGTLIALGTEAKNIIFTSNQPSKSPGDWGMIHFRDTSVDADCLIEYAVIEYGMTGVWCNRASPTIQHSTLQYHDYYGIGSSDTYGGLIIKDNTITQNNSCGVYIDGGGSVTLTENTITNNTGSWSPESGGDGGGVWASGPLTATGNTITGNQNGVGLMADGWTEIAGNTITGNKVGLLLYDNHPFNFNNLQDNSLYDVYIQGQGIGSLEAGYNWWGTTDASVIAKHIRDFYDDFNYYKVDYSPMMSAEVTDTTVSGPASPMVIINGGASTTDSRDVLLELSAESATEMIISEDFIFADVSWEAYTPSKAFTLSEEDGQKYVYAKFRNATQEESAIAFNSILLSTEGPQPGTPVVKDIPDITILKNGQDTSIDLDEYVTDEDGLIQTITWKAIGATNIIVEINSTTHVVTLTPKEDWVGAEKITFQATDLDGNEGSDEIVVAVIDNSPIITDIPNVTLKAGETKTFDLDDYVTDADTPKEDITWDASGEISIEVEIDDDTHQVTVTAPDDFAGSEDITFTATDPEDNSNSYTITVTVEPPSTPSPVVTDIPDITLKAGGTHTFDLDEYVTDEDTSKEDIIWDTSGEILIGVEIDPDTHEVTVSIPDDFVGSEDIMFTATDPEGNSDSDMMTVTVDITVLTIPDLTLSNDDISFTPSWATVPGIEVTIDATVHNQGETTATCDVSFYKDTKEAENLIDTASNVSVAGNDSTLIQTTLDTTGFSEGSYKIYVVISNSEPAESDTTNNEAEKELFVDVTPPDTQLVSGPQDGGFVNTTSVTFRWTGTDNVSTAGELLFAYKLDAADFTDFATNKSHTFDNLTEGAHTFVVKAQDKAGHEDPTPLTINFTVVFVDLQPTAISAPYGPDDVWSGQPMEVTWTVINNGISTISGSWMDKVYLSDDDQIGSDTLFSEFEHTGDLAGGTSYSNTQSVTLPSDISGDYWIVVETDSRNNVSEENAEGNNILVDDAAIHVNFTSPPDLQVTNVTPSGEALSGRQIYVDWTVANNGIGNASGSWQDRVYLSDDNQPGADTPLSEFQRDGGLNAGKSYTHSRPVTLPNGIQGDYWIIVETDCNDDVYETDAENNNVRVSDAPISVQMMPYPDLQVTSVDAPAEAWSGQSFSVSWTITNNGTGATDAPFWYDGVYLSVDATLDDSDTYLGRANNVSYLNPAESYVQTAEFTLPREIAGPFYLIVKTDHYNNVSEYNATSSAESNNVGYSEGTMQIQLSPAADLQVISVDAPDAGWSGQQISVTWEVKNDGGAKTEASSWYDALYLSQDEQLSTQEDYLLGTFYHEGVLDEDETYTQTKSVTLPVDKWGDHYVFVLTDANNRVYEQLWENNNSAYDTTPVSIALSPTADLEVTWLSGPAQCSAGNQITIDWKVANNGGDETNSNSWYDNVYLSSNETLEAESDTLLGRISHNGALAAGAEYNQSRTITIPKRTQGTYYLIVWTDSENSVFEYNGEDNNTLNTSTQILIADLEVSLVNAPAQCSSGSQITVDWTVANNGAGTTDVDSWYDSVYLSDNETLETGTDTLLGDFQRSEFLAAGANYVQSNIVKLPNGIKGVYYLIVWTDSENTVFESEENNNTRNTSSAVQVTLNLADLQVTSVNPPQSAVAGQSMFVQWEVTNAGTDGTGTAQWQDSLYLSVDQSLQTGTDISLGTFPHDGALASGATYTNSSTVTVPSNTSAGAYYLLVKTDINNDVDEYNVEENNVGSSESTVQVSATPTPDLQVTSVDAPETGDSGRNISISWTVTNTSGGANEATSWIDDVYLSLDPILDDNPDTRLGRFTHYGSLPAGGAYTRTESMKLPQAISGAYYILVKTDATDSEEEYAGEDNNVGFDATSMQVAFEPSDLQVTSVDVPDTGWAGQPITVNWTVSNEGTGETNASGWYDNLYFSKDTVLDNTDQNIGYHWHDGRLSASGNYTHSRQVSIPSGISGPGYIMVVADSNNQVYEHNNEDNNVKRSDAIQVTLTPLADLVVSQINVPASGSPGQPAVISWTVTNQSTSDAVGRWWDSIYLSFDETWDIGDAFVGSVEHNGTVGSGQDYTGSINTALPGAVPGDYYVIVRADIRNHVRESDEDNNVGISTNQISIGVTELTLGVPYQSQLSTGTEHYYKVTVPEGEDLLITLDSDSNISANELYVRYGAMPSIGQYDFLYDEPFGPDQEITVPGTQAGTYYFLVRGDSVPDAPVDYTLVTDLLHFSIRSIFPNQSGTVGYVTLEVLGAKFTDTTQVRLVPPEGARIDAELVSYVDSSRLFATFDLAEREPGVYDIELEDPNEGVGMLTAGFEITPGGGPQLIARLIAPENARFGQDFIIWLEYANVGDTDMISPFFVVSTTDDAFVSLYPDSEKKNSVRVWGVSSEYPPGILRPGTHNIVPLFTTIGNTAKFELKHVPADSTSIDWASLESEIRPTDEDDLEWSATWQDFQTNVGPSYGNLLAILAADATLSGLSSSQLVDFDKLLMWEVAIAPLIAQTKTFRSQGLPATLMAPQLIQTMDPTILAVYIKRMAVAWWSYDPDPQDYVDFEEVGMKASEPTRTFVICHGANDGPDDFRSLADTIKTKYPNARVLLVDWSGGSKTVDPWRAGRRTDEVGYEVAKKLHGRYPYLNFQSVTFCGHSHGCSVAGHAAKYAYENFEQVSGGFMGMNIAHGYGGAPFQNYKGYFGKRRALMTHSSWDSSWFDPSRAVDNFVSPDEVLRVDVPDTEGSDFLFAAHRWPPKLLVEWFTSNPQLFESILYMQATGYDGFVYDRNGNLIPDTVLVDNILGIQLDFLLTPLWRDLGTAIVEMIQSWDPNDKIAPAGSGAEGFISGDQALPYTINFENVPDATAPAEQVSITDQLDPDLDWRSFRLGEVAFGNTVVTVPENRSVYQTRLTLESGMFLDISAGVNIATGESSWLFRTIDPTTGEPPIDPSLGFLPPNDENHIGEGHVTFTIKPKSGLENGTKITNKATIVFDTNEAIDTNEVTNTIITILPDLTALSVGIESESAMPLEGDELTITATIKNNSEVKADGFNVRFFDGDPDAGGTEIGQQMIASVDAQDTQTAQIVWNSTRLHGEKYVYVKIDPENAVEEVNEQNNISSTSMVLSPRTFTVNFAQDINMFALPLEPETQYNARSLASMIGANMMVRYNTEKSEFEAFIPDFHEGDGFPIESSKGYIAVVDEAKPITFEGISHIGTVQVEPDINMFSLPLQPETPYTARSFSDLLAANLVVRYNNAKERFEPFIPDFHTGNGFQIKGGKGYIVFATEGKSVMFTGKGWLDGAQPPAPLLALNNAQSKTSSVFGVAGYIYNDDGKTPVSKTYEVTITNKRTDAHISAVVDATNGQYTGTFIDIFDQHPTSSGDKLEIVFKDSKDKIVGGPVIYIIAPDDIKNRYAKLNVSLVKQIPRKNMLRQNFPNPFNPETWVPYQLSKDANVTIKIYNVAGQLVRILELGQQPAGYYMEKEKAAHWNGRNDVGERASSGIYFYTIKAGKFTATKKMILLK